MIHQLEYGTLEVGTFDGRRRRDIYTSAATGERFREGIFAVNAADKSKPQESRVGHGYNPKCSCCYLNFGHTEEYHKQAIGGQS